MFQLFPSLSLRLFISSLMVCIGLLLNGCASLLPPGQQQLQQQLSDVQHWQVRGKLSVRSPADSVTGYLNWQQQGEDYQLFISGPFGQGSSQLTGSADFAELTLPGWPRPQRAANAEALMLAHLGWNFPVTDIRYWVKGQPSPTGKADSRFDDNGLLSELNQHGWQVRYSRYQLQQGQWLPGLIKISGHDFRFIFAIKEWTLLD